MVSFWFGEGGYCFSLIFSFSLLSLSLSETVLLLTRDLKVGGRDLNHTFLLLAYIAEYIDI